MSATDRHELPFENKDPSAFNPSFNPSFEGFFDLQFNMDQGFPESSDNSNESNFFAELDTGFSQGISFDEAALAQAGSPKYQQVHCWQANAWRQQKITPVPQSQKLVHRMRPDGVAISSTELLTLEGKLQAHKAKLAISSHPTTPPCTPCRLRESTRPASPSTPSHGSSRASTSVVSPKMMRPSDCTKQDSPPYGWTEQFQQITLQVPAQALPLSPPPSAKVPHTEQPSRLIIPNQDSDSTFSMSPASFAQHASRSQRRPRISPDNCRIPTKVDRPSPIMWMDTPITDFSAAQHQPQDRWSYMAHSTQIHNDNTEKAVPGQELTPTSLEFAPQGLGIEYGLYDDPFTDNPLPSDYVVSPFQLYSFESAIEDEEDYISDTALPNGPPVPPNSDFPSGSSSPESSTQVSSKSRRQSRHSRRKSSAVTTPRTPKTPGSGGDAVGFVNFTPSDSRKILTGVAPSGSSKTKARREKEASDRRRKLSEAAAKAVMEAGGDVEALRKEGLLI
ncbi:hypothetical protein MMC19_001174 [Ptychographa xylographoides]|nr:hypothetical protein [Ptychographa xylographoides]